MNHTISDVLPADTSGIYIGRVWDPSRELPVPVLYADGKVWDASSLASTTADLLELQDLNGHLSQLRQDRPTWNVEDIYLESQGNSNVPMLLAPLDAQVIKACGVTFVGSMIERVIEERSGGDPSAAAKVREQMQSELGVDLATVVPGGKEAEAVKQALLERNWWSQYLEVGLGPDPEVFTKAPVLAAVGSGSSIGIPAFSSWNNPEPELVLVVDSQGRTVGVTLGNDVNLRDVEGRSALLLGMAKDNNRSTAIGPFIRLIDDAFSLQDAHQLEISLTVDGPEGYTLNGMNVVSALSRTFDDLVEATRGDHHQYPDGFVLFTGTLFAPKQDRDVPGEGFTHKVGDIVTIATDKLGSLVNQVGKTEELPPWTYGIRSLCRDIARLEQSREKP
ncbi:fumarylacetoacetate hydrolase [Nesterenkonia salmonea]|uniref:Fumarylacetoacetate hydrolase n=2 Tax=Nesterenkonia salmonea TaxID=1804987 RepID=A0A5R9BKH4_9MICC|nr:fumarylacetoacetate hydrolase family protein [Nesterenkonia salmonea]TLQ01117.1 fumarylacetoacetate hydrolase [Nesterenkonia salmonea]